MSNSYDYLYTSDTVGRADFLGQDAIAPYRITSSSDVPALDFLFDYLPAERRDHSHLPTIVRGELTAVTGKAKTGKTFLTTMLAAAAIRPQCVNGTDTALTPYTTTDTLDQPAQNLPFRARTTFEGETLSVLWIDTEQSPASTKEILTERILPLAHIDAPQTQADTPQAQTDASQNGGLGHSPTSWVNLPNKMIKTERSESFCHFEEEGEAERLIRPNGADSVSGVSDDGIDIFNFRSIPDYTARLAAVRTAIESHPADLVIIDGIRDLVSDINSYNEAQTVIGMLLKLASDYQTAIVCVLHQNKSPENNTMRGAIGTELTNKAFETFECSQDPDTHILSFAQTMTRRYTLPGRYCYAVDPRGLPIPTYDPATTPYAATLATPIPAPTSPTVPASESSIVETIDALFGNDTVLLSNDLFLRLERLGLRTKEMRNRVLGRAHELHLITKTQNANCYYYHRLPSEPQNDPQDPLSIFTHTTSN